MKKCSCVHGDSDPYCPDPECPNYIAAYHVGQPASPEAGAEPINADQASRLPEHVRHRAVVRARAELAAEPKAEEVQERIHKNTYGGNDYIHCNDCGQEWDYRKPGAEPKTCKRCECKTEEGAST